MTVGVMVPMTRRAGYSILAVLSASMLAYVPATCTGSATMLVGVRRDGEGGVLFER